LLFNIFLYFFINYIIGNPIRVRRHAKRKKPNIFKDMQLTDDRADLEFLLEPEIGKIVSRSCKTVRDGTNIHPSFDFVFNEEIHGPELSSRLKLDSNMNPHLKERLLALIKKHFCVFIKKNVQITIEDYECHIDTGDHAPKVAKNIRFGIHETPIMQSAIDGLLQKNQIVPDDDSLWLAKPVLAPKPHQEDSTDHMIDAFLWRFCVSYI